MSKIILFNGPPRSGKDTCVDLLKESNRHIQFMSFASCLRKFAEEVLPVKDFEFFKDTPIDFLNGETPRQMVINLSEEFFKRRYGVDIYTKIAINKIKHTNKHLKREMYVFNDLGFPGELPLLLDAFGPENIILVHIYREGKDFSNDSRQYVYSDEIQKAGNFVVIHNNGSINDLNHEIMTKILTKI